MSALLQAELLKLRTTRTFVTLVGVALALSLLFVVLTGLLTKRFNEEETRSLFVFDFTGLIIMLLGVMGMAGEWRHRTITGTVLASPNRLALLTAKMLSYAAAGAVLSLIVQLTMFLVGSLILSARGFDGASLSTLADVLWRNLVIAALAGALGVGIGAVVRNQIVAIVGVLLVAMALEPLLYGLVPEVGRFAPTAGAPGGISKINPFGEYEDPDLLGAGAAVAVLLGWIGVFFAAAAARLRRGDLV
jgi:ABC-type transport system involved in multi-copper enzyme maturation permease subunit